MILNLRTDAWLAHKLIENGDAVLCDRTTMWGNPIPITNFVGRSLAVNWHRLIVQSGYYDAYLDRLVGKDLVCWCAPERCHCENYLERIHQLRMTDGRG